jgi:PAS domain S-box-containing protein
MERKTSHTYLLGFISALALLAVVAWFNWRHNAHMQEAAELVARTHEVQANLNRLLSLLEDVETGERGFIITGDPKFLEPFESGLNAVAEQQRRLGSLILDVDQKANLSALEPLIAERIAVARRQVELGQKSGFEAARQDEASSAGMIVMDKIRAHFAWMDEREQALLNERSFNARNETLDVSKLNFTGTGGSFALLITVFAFLLRENQLRERSEAQRDRFFDLSLDMLGIAGTDGYFKQISAAFSQTLGWSDEEILGRPFLDFVHPDDRLATLREVEKLAAGQATLHFENRYRCKDGSWKWLSWKTQPVPKEGLLYAAARDVTEMKAIADALRASEVLIRTVLNSVMANIAVVDRHGTIIALNESWERFAQENRDDTSLLGGCVGANYLEVCERAAQDLGDEAQEILNGIRGVMACSQATFRHEYPSHSPTEQRWFSMQVSPLTREEGGAVVAHIDITERKHAERLLTDFKAALDKHAIVAITASNGKITYANDKFCAISKYSREELLGQDHRIINSGHHPKAFIRNLWKTIISGRVWHGEIKNRAKDGSFYWLKTTILPFLEADGKPCQFITIRTDITVRKQHEEEVGRLNADLSRRSTALEAANKELEAFSYSVSHDLRAPLRGIDGFSRMLVEDYGDKLDDTAKGYLRRVRAAAGRMAQLIDDMLNLSRITRTEMQRQAVDLSALARLIADKLQNREPQRPVQWEIGEGLVAEGDPNLLQIVLKNLLGNAWKFTGKKTGTRIEFGRMNEGAASVPTAAGGDGLDEARLSKNDAVFYVRDNGAGFDMTHVQKLFGAFQRLHAMTEFEGTGVGLATVQRIVHRHGGRVWAEAEVDKGATFYFTL